MGNCPLVILLVCGLTKSEKAIRGENIFFFLQTHTRTADIRIIVFLKVFQNAVLKATSKSELRSSEVMLPRKLAKAMRLRTFNVEVLISNL